MSNMGKVIMEIQELAYQGIPNAEIAKFTKTSPDFVEDVVKDSMAIEFRPGHIYPKGTFAERKNR